MSDAACEHKPPQTSRPVGMVEPPDEAPDGALGEASAHLAQGLACIRDRRPSEAERPLLRAAARSFEAGLQREGAPDAYAMRVAALAMHHLGFVLRRQDRPMAARRCHLCAYELRRCFGSYDEIWQAATELGLDADVAGRPAEAQRWYRRAIEAGASAGQSPLQKQADAWTHLVAALSEDKAFDEAIAAARTARELWRQHDLSAVTAARADLTLGRALLERAAHGHGMSDVADTLVEAVDRLHQARDALLAFGRLGTEDAARCEEQLDFAKRLG